MSKHYTARLATRLTTSVDTRLRQLAATLPPDSIVLGTDAPDIPPRFLQPGHPHTT